METFNAKIWDPERKTQDRVLEYLTAKLWYKYLWNWMERKDNSCVEVETLKNWLLKQNKYSKILIEKAIKKLVDVALDRSAHLYDINKEVYSMLRYWVEVKESLNDKKVSVFFIDWDNIENNVFEVAEEVTIEWLHDKRPDIVLYVNGLALWVIELKRASVSVKEWIRQNLDNQDNRFIKNFFATQQLVMAWNESEWLYYWTIETPEKYYLSWKEDKGKSITLYEQLNWLLRKERFLDIIHNFVVFDSWVKKLCRYNQFFAVKASQDFLKRNEWWIIWHTQWSWKSLTMVWLAKWIKENIDDSRVFIITDREELDWQIEKVFKWVKESIYRCKRSWSELIQQLSKKDNTLVCSLIHKFWRKKFADEETEEDLDIEYNNFIESFKLLPHDFKPQWKIYVFVDECHRTQTWKLHKAMREIMPEAVFIWFTWTPLLKKDKDNLKKKSSNETFWKYIHTYKFDQAIKDNVVLDLKYEARNIDQWLTSPKKVDAWFEDRTHWLSDIAKEKLKKEWWTMQVVLSSKWRLEKIVSDIIFDFWTKPRLRLWRWNAMLVASSIYEACKYYNIFQSLGFKKCAVVSSYVPTIASIKWESTWENQISANQEKYNTYMKMVSSYFNKKEDDLNEKDFDAFEQDVKTKFVDEPWQMQLLIVVDKLLTWFDAPSATYLYIDKSMQDHWLFQAICRVNRLDDKAKWDEFDKDYWYIVDYKDLFQSLEWAIDDYTSGAFDGYDKEDITWLLTNRLKEGKKRLDECLEIVEWLIEMVKEPKEQEQFKEYFIWDDPSTEEWQRKQDLRSNLYKQIASLNRAYINIANEMSEAWYTSKEIAEIQEKIKKFQKIKEELMIWAWDYLDLKSLNADMRYMIDAYIQSWESEVISAFEHTTLLDMISQEWIEETIKKLPKRIRKNENATAETIENNIRRLITDEQAVNPIYYERMSKILEEIVKKRKEQALKYKEYLQKISEFIENLKDKNDPWVNYPESIKDSIAKRAIYDMLWNDEELTLKIDHAIRTKSPNSWRWSFSKSLIIKNAIAQLVWDDDDLIEKLFELIKNQDEY